MASQARGPVAVLLAGNEVVAAVGGGARGQAEGVGQADEGHEFAQLLQAAQVGGFQVETPVFQVLEALLIRPPLGVALREVVQAGRGKQPANR